MVKVLWALNYTDQGLSSWKTKERCFETEVQQTFSRALNSKILFHDNVSVFEGNKDYEEDIDLSFKPMKFDEVIF